MRNNPMDSTVPICQTDHVPTTAPHTGFPESFENTCAYCGVAVGWWEDEEVYVPASNTCCNDEAGHYPL